MVVPHGDQNNLELIQLWWNVCDQFSKSLQDNNCLLSLNSPSSSSSSFSTSQEVIIKSYPSSRNDMANTFSDSMKFGVDPESDFATYRIKWSSDVESYFNTAAISPTTITRAISKPEQSPTLTDLAKNSRHGRGNYLFFNGGSDDQDDTFYDGRYYSDD